MFPKSKATVELHVMHAGKVFLLEHMIFNNGKKDGEPDTFVPLNAWVFLITHPDSGKKVLFDLGIRKDLDAYPPVLKAKFSSIFRPNCEVDPADHLQQHGIDPSSVSAIIYSHPHFDHIGDHSRFPNATCIYGDGTQAFARPAYPLNEKSNFLESSFPEGRTKELSAAEYTTSVGPFDKAHDFFGDGSVYLLDGPGHMPGHTLALVHTAKGYFLLAGDAGHDYCYLTDCDSHKLSYYMHADKGKAKETLRKIGELQKLCEANGAGELRVFFAHAGEHGQFEKLG